MVSYQWERSNFNFAAEYAFNAGAFKVLISFVDRKLSIVTSGNLLMFSLRDIASAVSRSNSFPKRCALSNNSSSLGIHIKMLYNGWASFRQE